MFEKVSEHVYLFEDTCNVYVVKDGVRAVLIDFGSGRVLDHLGDLGIDRVDWILHTHHHRDQCQGDALANQRRIPIAVPAHERPYFEEVEVFWGSRQIYNIYNVRQSFFTLTESVRTDRVLEDYESFAWGPYSFFAQPTPGHTLGHVALIAEIDGSRIAFSGDLTAAPGKVQTLYDLQYTYGAGDGVDYMIYSLAKLRARGADLLCPSHGRPFGDTEKALSTLESKFREYLKHRWGIEPTHDIGPRGILPHLVQIPGCSNTWAVVSDSGKALLVDYGSQSITFMFSYSVFFEAGNRLRMFEHNLELLRDQFGIRQFDLALPSHYHDDHVNGLPYLQKHCGTRIWCYHNMVDIMQHPHGYKLGCTHPEPVQVERGLEQGETFQWEEYEFQVFHTPGHADYHMAMFGTIDGKRVAFSGDEIGVSPDGSYVSNNIWRNHVHANSHEITGRLYLEHQPELTCPGHAGPFEMTPSHWEKYHDWCMREQEHWRALADPDNLEPAVYPDYVFLYPYQPPAAPGEEVRMQVWFENVFPETATLDYALVLPEGWSARPDRGRITGAPGEKKVADFVLEIPVEQSTRYRRQAMALDATIDGKHLGQLAEAVVDLRPELDWGTGGESPRRSLADG